MIVHINQGYFFVVTSNNVKIVNCSFYYKTLSEISINLLLSKRVRYLYKGHFC